MLMPEDCDEWVSQCSRPHHLPRQYTRGCSVRSTTRRSGAVVGQRDRGGGGKPSRRIVGACVSLGAVSSGRTIVYIDGHNFYHGCVKKHPGLKWLDLVAMASRLAGRNGAIDLVRYYTARVIDYPDDPKQSQRQDVYLKALEATGVEVIEGHFVERSKRVKLKKTGRYETAIVAEEKGSDVNLAADLVHDACTRTPDLAVVISNDSDLQRAVHLAMRCGVTVYTVNPHRSGNQRPKLFGSGSLNIRRWHLAQSQLPPVVVDSNGKPWSRPPEWSS